MSPGHAPTMRAREWRSTGCYLASASISSCDDRCCRSSETALRGDFSSFPVLGQPIIRLVIPLPVDADIGADVLAGVGLHGDVGRHLDLHRDLAAAGSGALLGPDEGVLADVAPGRDRGSLLAAGPGVDSQQDRKSTV